ncbi:MAG: alpha/beta fold hydrolase [Thermoleophilaceae bacterium]|nr:alpha/beta fold hydrolase [Thermoleophilaceae bacterium]
MNSSQTLTRNDIEFDSHGDTVRAWHFPPASDALTSGAGAPLVVMGHGLGLTRDCGLEPYAKAFTAAGCHVMIMDYRGFGASEGTPRQLVSITREIQDYQSAIRTARTMDGVDPARIALWGTSYSGGVVVHVAAEDGNIAAVISQVPNLDNLATGLFIVTHSPPLRLLWLGWAIVRDFVGGLLGLKPYYVPGMGREGERASYVSNESMDIFDRMAGPSFRNRFAPRDFLRFPPFRPITKVDKLPCRIQLMGCNDDKLTPIGPTLKAARIAGARGELHRYPGGHFGIYVDEVQQDALVKQAGFLAQELAPAEVVQQAIAS